MIEEMITRPRPIATTITVRTRSSRSRLLERPRIDFVAVRTEWSGAEA